MKVRNLKRDELVINSYNPNRYNMDEKIRFAERTSFEKYLRNNPIEKGHNVLIIIGPEGGFSDSEFEYFKINSIPMLSLGSLILKAETAVITTIGNIVYEFV